MLNIKRNYACLFQTLYDCLQIMLETEFFILIRLGFLLLNKIKLYAYKISEFSIQCQAKYFCLQINSLKVVFECFFIFQKSFQL